MLAAIVSFVSAAVIFLGADFAWLSLSVPRLYRPTLGPMLAEKVNAGAALAFYLVYLLGIEILAVAPALRSGGWRTAALHGFVLGITAYGTYDLTNQATLKFWSTRLTLADMAWGGALTAFAACAGFLAARRFA